MHTAAERQHVNPRTCLWPLSSCCLRSGRLKAMALQAQCKSSSGVHTGLAGQVHLKLLLSTVCCCGLFQADAPHNVLLEMDNEPLVPEKDFATHLLLIAGVCNGHEWSLEPCMPLPCVAAACSLEAARLTQSVSFARVCGCVSTDRCPRNQSQSIPRQLWTQTPTSHIDHCSPLPTETLLRLQHALGSGRPTAMGILKQSVGFECESL